MLVIREDVDFQGGSSFHNSSCTAMRGWYALGYLFASIFRISLYEALTLQLKTKTNQRYTWSKKLTHLTACIKHWQCDWKLKQIRDTLEEIASFDCLYQALTMRLKTKTNQIYIFLRILLSILFCFLGALIFWVFFSRYINFIIFLECHVVFHTLAKNRCKPFL